MRTFKYALLVGIGLTCITPKVFAESSDQQEVAALEQKAIQGDPEAQYSLGYMYENGEGVPQDYVKAVEWYSKAADQGDGDGQFNLGVMYKNGEGVSQDYSKAFELYSKAADQGNGDAQYNLGAIYENGKKTIPQDKVRAKEYYKQACLNKSQDGCDAYKRLNKE